MADNPILDGLLYDPEQGALTFNGVRYMLIRPETVMEFQKAVEADLGAERCGELIYQGGFAGGSLSTKRYREAFDKTDREAADFMCEMGGPIGWGGFALSAFDAEAGLMEVAVTGSPFAEAYGPSDRPVCHFIRGVVGGMASVLLDAADSVAVETACVAAGAPDCQFRVSR